jgi:DNA-binding CsgD family transcriptional regulator
MVELPAQHLKKALDFVLDISALDDAGSFAEHVVNGLPRMVASELTTLSICDLQSGVRRVVSFPENAISVAEQQSFNRLIHVHPLVRYHASHAGGGAWRISDSLPMTAFKRQELYADYYRRIGIDHVVAVPIVSTPRLVMSFVLNRSGRDFADSECRLLNRLQPALANLYRVASMMSRLPHQRDRVLTPREDEILHWVGAGKSDAQIAAILGLSTRTVQKHLENSYVKLGVENRTAAAMIVAASNTRFDS